MCLMDKGDSKDYIVRKAFEMLLFLTLYSNKKKDHMLQKQLSSTTVSTLIINQHI